jgi:hypothetical protein
MTVFWSDPTKIRLTPPTGDELEEEYFNPPNNLEEGSSPKEVGAKLHEVLKIDGPGVAEIKAHNRNGIAGAIEQLNNPKIKVLNRIIITYRPTGWSRKSPGITPSPLTLDVFATKFEPTAKPPGLTRKQRKGPDVPLTGMDVGYYHTDERGKPPAPAKWVLVKKQVPIPPTIPVNLDNGSVLGAAAEDPVRTAFAVPLKEIKIKGINLGLTWKSAMKKPDDNQNPDVEWEEIAEMYAELARITNNEFFAELANELAALP